MSLARIHTTAFGRRYLEKLVVEQINTLYEIGVLHSRLDGGATESHASQMAFRVSVIDLVVVPTSERYRGSSIGTHTHALKESLAIEGARHVRGVSPDRAGQPRRIEKAAVHGLLPLPWDVADPVVVFPGQLDLAECVNSLLHPIVKGQDGWHLRDAPPLQCLPAPRACEAQHRHPVADCPLLLARDMLVRHRVTSQNHHHVGFRCNHHLVRLLIVGLQVQRAVLHA
mmetsp:Transcript_8497/g.18061  ORF Transcript_8497/g.18061 Transcript_8497/m.18061 type:complete len:227 (+) Transcript_8497:2057-2737(+)